MAELLSHLIDSCQTSFLCLVDLNGELSISNSLTVGQTIIMTALLNTTQGNSLLGNTAS